MTWNIECLKPHQFVLADTLLSRLPDIVSIGEPQVYQADVSQLMSCLNQEYCYSLNSEDVFDPELPQIKSRAVGGTLALWRKWLDPYVTILPTQSPAFLPLLLRLPGARISVHIAIYLPTHGKDPDFIDVMAALKNCIDDLNNKYINPIIFIRGDGNSNPKNVMRSQILNHFIQSYGLSQVAISHPTYHHFVGDGLYDSNIDIILHTGMQVCETVTEIVCKNQHPEISSHHDIILSKFNLPYQPSPTPQSGLKVAPRTAYLRSKILWTDEGKDLYRNIVTSQLQELRMTWLDSNSKANISVLLDCTNTVLNIAAITTNPSKSLDERGNEKALKTPHVIKVALRKLKTKQKLMLKRKTLSSMRQLQTARNGYRQAVRANRLRQSVIRDSKLDTILSKDPRKIFLYLRSIRRTKTKTIQSLTVGSKIYTGDRVGDGFYESMTSLKSCNIESLKHDQDLSHHFSNYQHIMKICQAKQNIPPISVHAASKLLSRMKTHVTDIYGVTPLHYLYAGDEGILHYTELLNSLITEVNNVTLAELNRTLGIILYKGHRKDKNSDRSYRTISTCPLLAKSVDLYARDLLQEQWQQCTASTQYLAAGSSHELASLLVTEVVQYSLHTADLPVYLLVLDAQSAYDRCLREILCTELFSAGITGSALLLLNNRLEYRSTVYHWDGEMLGPAVDNTGFEQGGINSGDFYKLYNNEQLKSAQKSGLGVDIGSSVVAAVGQADDVILAASSLISLKLLARLTEVYCASYRVKLVASKTKLLPMYLPRHAHLVDYTKLVNTVTVDNTAVEYVQDAEHVGVIRSCTGNMPNILHRVACYKQALQSLSPAGITKSQRGNPAANLRVHQLYAVPVLFSGVASLYLTEPEIKVLEINYKKTVQNLQRLHQNTPRSVVFLLGGCLPARAVLHTRQLSLFLMICHLPDNPLHVHAKYILEAAKPQGKSWFNQLSHLCGDYGLPTPTQLLENPPPKKCFTRDAKKRIVSFWHAKLASEVASLKSLKYFKPELYSLTKPHYMWLTAAGKPFECAKSTVLARMASGRFRTDMLKRYWSSNRSGYCRAPTCNNTPGTLEHLLVECPGLAISRERLYRMWLERTVMFPTLHAIIRNILDSDDKDCIVQFILEPLVFPPILENFRSHGVNFRHQLSYLTRTFAFYIHREYEKLVEPTILPPPLRDNIFPNSCSVSASRWDVTNHCMPATSTPPDLSYTVPIVPVPVPCNTVPTNTLPTNTHPVLATSLSSNVGAAQYHHTDQEHGAGSLCGAVASQERRITTMTGNINDWLGDEEGNGESVRVFLAL